MREKILFDENWIFHRGDIKPPFPKTKGTAYVSAKTQRCHIGPASASYVCDADSYSSREDHCSEHWVRINLPHDYIIEGKFSENRNSALGYLPYENAWYRKKFTLPSEDEGRRITLYFEGVATHATVYLNGCLMKHNFCGYTSFEVDISDCAIYGGENILAVYVSTEDHEGWWYEGGGIYRHVWLCKAESTSIDLYGIYVASERKSGDEWNLRIENTVRRDEKGSAVIRAVSEVRARSGGVLLTTLTSEGKVYEYEKTVLKSETVILNPRLWSPADPFLYDVETVIYVLKGGEFVECDRARTHMGFREIYADPKKGLFINGEHVQLKGLCGHADFGLSGKAVPDNIHREKVHLMKEMGANAYRCSHYPQAEVLMDAFDEFGMLVMDETRWFESTDEGLEQLRMLILRDRNRPSVIFWSVGNEEPLFVSEQGRRICRRMMAEVRKFDKSRLIVTANDKSPNRTTVYGECEAIGINYNIEMFDEVHAIYPDKAIFSSENCATSTTRGWYHSHDARRGYYSAYDSDMNDNFVSREKTWKYIASREWIMGGFQWIAFEHRGESVWPRLCSQSGAIDLFMQKKDAFYQNQSMWLDAPMVHLLPHWNFEGLEGESIRVSAYTNCDEVELFLNGESLGRIAVERFGHAEWSVLYRPGELSAIGYRDGAPVASDRKATSGRGERLLLKLENREKIRRGGNDMAIVSCTVLDCDGREVPTATPFVRFTADGGGYVYSTGSDVCDHESVFSPSRQMRAGRITVALKLFEHSESVKLYAESDNLASASLEISAK